MTAPSATSDSLGICTSVFGHRLALTAAKIRLLEGTGIEWIEIAALQTQHLNVFDDQRVDELVAALAESPLKVWSLHAPFCGMAMDDADTRADGLRKLVQAARVAERFGAGCIVVHPGRDVPSGDRPREIQWTRDGVAWALDSMPQGIALALETMGRQSIGGPSEEMLGILDGFEPARVGICLDTGHVNLGGDVIAYAGCVAGRIATVHLHDNYGDQDDHALPGEGNLDWPAVIAALRAAKYQGPLICEGGSVELSPEETTRQYVRRMQQFCNG